MSFNGVVWVLLMKPDVELTAINHIKFSYATIQRHCMMVESQMACLYTYHLVSRQHQQLWPLQLETHLQLLPKPMSKKISINRKNFKVLH